MLFLPPLRHRGEDILLLAHHFAARMAFELGHSEIPQFSRHAKLALQDYAWKGNVRELKNVVERAVYKADNEAVAHIEFDPFISPFPAEKPKFDSAGVQVTTTRDDFLGEVHQSSFKQAVTDFEVSLVKNALVKSQYNQKKAATILGLTYDQFRGLLRKYKEIID